MLRWCSRHPIWFMAGYLMLYLAVFRWQELHLTPVVWVHTPLDDLIPFCEYAILPYLAWFVWIPFTLFALLRGPRTDFMRLCLPLFAGMTAALTCYMLLPTGLALAYRRSQIFAGANRRWLRAASYGLCIAICASTMLLKQHSCIDVAFGLALAFAMDSAARALWRRKAWEERLA